MKLFINMKDWSEKGERVISTLDGRRFDLHNDTYIENIQAQDEGGKKALVFDFMGKYYVEGHIDKLSEDKRFQVIFHDVNNLRCRPVNFLLRFPTRVEMDDFLYRYDKKAKRGCFVWTEDTGSREPDSRISFDASLVEFNEEVHA